MIEAKYSSIIFKSKNFISPDAFAKMYKTQLNLKIKKKKTIKTKKEGKERKRERVLIQNLSFFSYHPPLRKKKCPLIVIRHSIGLEKNTAEQLNHMHHSVNYEQFSCKLCNLCWPSPVLLQFMKHDKTTDKVDLCCRLFVLSTQMVCHNAMSPNTVPSLFSFICFSEVL